LGSLMYHEGGDEAAATVFQRPGALGYKHSTAAFTEHLRRIDAAAVVKPGRVVDVDFAQPGRHLLLTFDDGGKSALFAADLLARHGWTGHFFIVTSLIGSRTFLNAEGVRALRSGGHRVGRPFATPPMIFRFTR